MPDGDTSLFTWGWIFLVFYIGIMVACGWIGMRRVKNSDDFATARGGYGPWFLAFALAATTASGGTFLGLPGIAYKDGFAGLWYAFIYPFGVYTGIIVCARVVTRAGATFGNRSIPEYLGDRYQSDFLRVAAAIFSLLLLFYLAAQLLAGAVMFERMLGLQFGLALVVTSGVLLLYIALGGAHADILTDGIQGALMLLIAFMVIALFFIGYGVPGGFAGMVERVRELDPATVMILNPKSLIVGSWWAIFCIWFAHVPLGMLPHIGNKLWALRDDKDRTLFLSVTFVFGVVMPGLALGGILARAVLGDGLFAEGQNPNYSIPALFIELLPTWLAAFLGAGVLAAVMSTADGLAVSASQIFANDIYRRTLAPRNPALSVEQIDRTALRISRVATALILVLAMAMAAYFHQNNTNIAIIIWLGIGGMTAALTGPFMIGAIWRGVTRSAALAGFTVGALCFITMSLIGEFVPEGWVRDQFTNPFARAAIGGIASSVVTLVVSTVTQALPEAHLDRMFKES